MDWKACWMIALCVGFLGCGKSQEGDFHTYSTDNSPTETKSAGDGDRETTENSNVSAEDEQFRPIETAEPLNPSTKRVASDALPPTAPAVAEKPNTPKPQSTVDAASLPKEPEPLEIKVLVPNKEFQEVGPENAIRVSYDDIDLLKVLNMDPVPADCVKYFPDWLKNLDGKRIRLRGFMYPPFQETDLPFFVLARDNAICCFGRDPKRYDVIDVTMRDGETTDYIANRPFDVVGVFHIAPETSQGQLYQLYLIDDAIVIEP